MKSARGHITREAHKNGWPHICIFTLASAQFHAMSASCLLVSPDSDHLCYFCPGSHPASYQANWYLSFCTWNWLSSQSWERHWWKSAVLLQRVSWRLFIFFWATVEVKSFPWSWYSNTSGDYDLIVLSFQQCLIPSSSRASLVPIWHLNLWVSLTSKSLHILSLYQEYCFWNIYPAYSFTSYQYFL